MNNFKIHTSPAHALNFVLIPEAYVKAFRNNKQPLKDILLFEKASKILSPKDLMFYSIINTNLKVKKIVFGGDVYGYFNHYKDFYKEKPNKAEKLMIYSEAFRNCDLDAESGVDNGPEKYFAQIAEDRLEQALREIVDTWFTNGGEENNYINNDYSIVDLDGDNYGIIFKPGVFPNYNTSKKLVHDLVSKLYNYGTLPEFTYSGIYQQHLHFLMQEALAN